MNDLMCMNHPEWPADPISADDGPPLCESCARAAGLPAAEDAGHQLDASSTSRVEVGGS